MTEQSDSAVADFFSRLLTKPQASTAVKEFSEPKLDTEQAQLQQLLSNISSIEEDQKLAEEIDETVCSSIALEPSCEIESSDASISKEMQPLVDIEIEKPLLQQRLDTDFQALFFKVAGLTLAVPLVELGGIIHEVKVNNLPGQPSWMKGILTSREQKINVVDTAAWVMPEKYDTALQEQVEYQYVVLLQNSKWGLACEELLDAESINKEQINWRTNTAKRPWLAGLVKKQMCGILDVDALVEQLSSQSRIAG